MYLDRLDIDSALLAVQQHPSAKISEKVVLHVEGENNRLFLGERTLLGALRLHVVGRQNTIILEDGVQYRRGHLRVVGDHQTVRIGKSTIIQKCYFLCAENCNITVGEDCFFAEEIVVRTTDAHSVLDINTRQRINKADSISIGRHVLLHAHVMVTKGVSLPDDCVVEPHSICNRTIHESHTVIAGVPAKVVQQGVTWEL